MSLSQRVRDRRVQLGINQKSLAIQLGVTQGSVAQIESGARSPSLGLLPVLARALGVSVDYLLEGNSSEMLDIGALNASDRLLIRKFYEYLIWLKGKAS